MSASATTLRGDATIIGLIGGGHMVSHFFQLTLPPLFPLIKDELTLSYAQLGLIMTVFFIASGVCQFLSGFVVDRYGAKRVLVVGMVLLAASIAGAGLANGYGMLLLLAALAGLGNGVFHPADYALLNHKVSRERLSFAFSIHGVGGSIGWAVAPLFSLGAAQLFGWRYAVALAGLLGLVYATLLGLTRTLDEPRATPHARASPVPTSASTFAFLAEPPILMCMAFFFFYATALMGIQSFAVPAVQQLYAAPLTLATSALTALFVGNALGLFAGGFIAHRSRSHEWSAALGMAASAFMFFVLAAALFPAAALPLLMAAAGFANGTTGPSRDLIVRANAPKGATGRVYGMVYSGLDVGAFVGPVVFGWLLDHGQPRAVFVSAGVLVALTILTVVSLRASHARRRATAPGSAL